MRRRAFLAACAAALAAGCASTSIVNQWESSTDRAPAFTRLLVVGLTQSASVRRIFEDEMVKALAARGVLAIPSYSLIPEDGPVPEARLAEAVQKAAAEGVLTTRVVQIAQQMEVVPSSAAFWGPPWGFYGWYGGAWGPAYAFPPQVVTRDVVFAEVRLFRAKPDTLVWAASTETFAPRDARRESAAFAQVVLEQLAARKLI